MYFIQTISSRDKFFVVILFTLLLSSLVFLSWQFYDSHTVVVPQGGGVYRVEMVGSPKNVVAILPNSTEVDKNLTKLMFQGIYRYDFTTRTYVPDIAEKVVIDVSKKIYTFYIPEKAKWHDGKSVTSDDVIFTYAQIYDSSLTFNKIDDHIFQVLSPQPDVFIRQKMLRPVLPVHALSGATAENLQEHEFMRKPFGSGPFKLISISPTQAKLAKFEGFVGEPVYFNSIVFNFYNRFSNIKIQQADNILDVPAPVVTTVRQARRFRIHETTQQKFTAVFFNLEKQILRHKILRAGIAYLIDRNEIVNSLFGATLSNLIPQKTTAYALKLINSVGYKLYGDVLSRHTGNRFESLTLNLVFPKINELPAIAKIIQNKFKSHGVQVKLIQLGEEKYAEAIRTRNYELLLTGIDIGIERDLYAFIHSSQREYPGKNLANLENEKVDLLTEQLQQEDDIDIREELNNKLDKELVDEIPFLPLYSKTFYLALDPKVKGVNAAVLDDVSDLMWDLRGWYVNEKREWK